MMKKRRWKRSGRVYRFSAPEVQSLVFSAPPPFSMWAWAVWASKFSAEGVEFSLKRAKEKANEQLDRLEAKQVSVGGQLAPNLEATN